MYDDTCIRCNVVYSSLLSTSYHHGSDCTLIWNPRPQNPLEMITFTYQNVIHVNGVKEKWVEYRVKGQVQKPLPRKELVGLFNTWQDAITICYDAIGCHWEKCFVQPQKHSKPMADIPWMSWAPEFGSRSKWSSMFTKEIVTCRRSKRPSKGHICPLSHTQYCPHLSAKNGNVQFWQVWNTHTIASAFFWQDRSGWISEGFGPQGALVLD